MKYLIVLFIVTGCFIFTFNSCEFGDKLTGEYYLTDEMKNALPYKGGEKVYYRLQDNSQIVLEAGIRYNKVEEISEGLNTNEYYILEREYMWLDNDSISIYYRLYGKYYHSPLCIIHCSYNGGVQFEFVLPLNKETSDYTDSLYVIDRWIKDLYITKENFYRDGQIIGQSIINYSTQYGIVKWERPDGLIMQLESIEW